MAVDAGFLATMTSDSVCRDDSEHYDYSEERDERVGCASVWRVDYGEEMAMRHVVLVFGQRYAGNRRANTTNDLHTILNSI